MRHTILSLRKHCSQIGDIVVISAAEPARPSNLTRRPSDLVWRGRFLFTLADFAGCNPSPNWVFSTTQAHSLSC